MENKWGTESVMQESISSILNTVVAVITNPVGFFKDMPKSGGLMPPLIFAVALGTVAGVVRTLLGILGIGFVGSFGMALAQIVIMPIIVAIGSFIGAAIMFVIWKIMGSQESFETSYRCCAYASAISPITSLLHAIPYLGSILGLVWMMYLLVIASIEVHGINAKNAWIVFGALCALLAILSVSSEHAARNINAKMGALQQQLEQVQKMSPEEQGKAVGEFMKGFQKGTGEK